jgi:hypothetical protein
VSWAFSFRPRTNDDRYQKALATWRRHADEWAYVKRTYPSLKDVTTGLKGLLYEYNPGKGTP